MSEKPHFRQAVPNENPADDIEQDTRPKLELVKGSNDGSVESSLVVVGGDLQDELGEAEMSPDEIKAEDPVVSAETATGLSGLRESAKKHKTELLIGSALASMAFLGATQDVSEVIDEIETISPWVPAAYVGGHAMYFGGLAMMGAAAGQKVGLKSVSAIKENMGEIKQGIRESELMHLGFWTNSIGAVGAASAAGYGIVSGLPAESWGLLAIPAADLYSTVAIRAAVYPYLKKPNKD